MLFYYYSVGCFTGWIVVVVEDYDPVVEVSPWLVAKSSWKHGENGLSAVPQGTEGDPPQLFQGDPPQLFYGAQHVGIGT